MALYGMYGMGLGKTVAAPTLILPSGQIAGINFGVTFSTNSGQKGQPICRDLAIKGERSGFCGSLARNSSKTPISMVNGSYLNSMGRLFWAKSFMGSGKLDILLSLLNSIAIKLLITLPPHAGGA